MKNLLVVFDTKVKVFIFPTFVWYMFRIADSHIATNITEWI